MATILNTTQTASYHITTNLHIMLITAKHLALNHQVYTKEKEVLGAAGQVAKPSKFKRAKASLPFSPSVRKFAL